MRGATFCVQMKKLNYCQLSGCTNFVENDALHANFNFKKYKKKHTPNNSDILWTKKQDTNYGGDIMTLFQGPCQTKV